MNVKKRRLNNIVKFNFIMLKYEQAPNIIFGVLRKRNERNPKQHYEARLKRQLNVMQNIKCACNQINFSNVLNLKPSDCDKYI